MENATRALIIAAGVLVGMMIVLIGVYLYTVLGNYVSETEHQIEINAIQKFNTQFLKYNNVKLDNNGRVVKDEYGNVQTYFTISLQDIITVANIAYENNQKYSMSVQEHGNNSSTLYVTVNANINGDIQQTKNLEKDINEKSVELLSNDNGYKYKCYSSDIKISEETGRVYEINFQ